MEFVLDTLNYFSILMLVVLGLVVIFGLMNVINMAHGEFFLVGAYTVVALQQWGAPFWLGLRGPAGTLTLVFGPSPGRSPHYWLGPAIGPGAEFDFHVAVNPAMGPGGVLFRRRDDPRWTSLAAASATGLEDFDWPSAWSVCHGQGGPDDRPFAGAMRDVQLRY